MHFLFKSLLNAICENRRADNICTTDIGTTISQLYSIIDASFTATLTDLQDRTRMKRLVDTSPLMYVLVKGCRNASSE